MVAKLRSREYLRYINISTHENSSSSREDAADRIKK